jgi:hypothetical protein
VKVRLGRGRLVAAAVVTGACAGALAAPSFADDWQASYAGQCCYQTLESGETATNWFDERNVGAKTWYQAFVNLGTDAPHDRSSIFYNPDDWLSAGRPTPLDQPTVPPGEVGRFTFVVKAPSVQQQTAFQENFQPVADGFAWMGGGVFLQYTVLPSQPPAVQITSAPASAQAGDPVSVAASATDNRMVDHLTFTLGGHTETLTEANGGPNTYAATLSTEGLTPGIQTIRAGAYDKAGNSSFSNATFYLYPKPAEPEPNPQPPSPASENDGPLPKILVQVAMVDRKLNGVTVTKTVKGARVRLNCIAKCARNLSKSTTARGQTTKLGRSSGLKLSKLTTLRVAETKKGQVGRYVIFRVRLKDGAVRRRGAGCLKPGKPKRTACPK